MRRDRKGQEGLHPLFARLRASGVALLLVAAVAAGCAVKRIPIAETAEEAFAWAMERYRAGDWEDAVSGFQRVIFSFPGNSRVEQAMFHLADSYFRDGDYLLAANEFKRVAAEYPDDAYAPVALYRLGVCHARLSLDYRLDQKDTRRAIESFRTVISRFPTTAWADSARARIADLRDKLARKEFESGYYYFKHRYYDSAIIYFEILREEYGDTRWVSPALYHLYRAYRELDLPDDAAEAREELLRSYPDSAEARKLKAEHQGEGERSQASAG
jgi:outer membrane protein assembly factor BamD